MSKVISGSLVSNIDMINKSPYYNLYETEIRIKHMKSRVEIIEAIAERYQYRLRILVQQKQNVIHKRVMSLWIDSADVKKTFNQDESPFVIAQVKRNYLKDNGINVFELERVYNYKDKRDINGYLVSIKEIMYRGSDKTKLDPYYMAELEKFIKELDAEAKRVFPKIGIKTIRQTYSRLVRRWTRVEKKTLHDQKTVSRQKEAELRQREARNQPISDKGGLTGSVSRQPKRLYGRRKP